MISAFISISRVIFDILDELEDKGKHLPMPAGEDLKTVNSLSQVGVLASVLSEDTHSSESILDD
jgi:hypothetical protein